MNTRKQWPQPDDSSGHRPWASLDGERWPLERVLFALAGTVTLVSAAFAATVSKWFLVLTAFVGVNQWLYVVAGACPASVVLRRACRLRSAMYDEKAQATPVSRAPEVRV
jgi:hypothetical protein